MFGEEIRRELVCAAACEPAEKDILVVVHDQLPYLEACIESIRCETQDYRLYVWDNGSSAETASWLASQPDIHLVRWETNEGFIIPNNRLISLGSSPYVILLNSDTIVLSGWDRAMLGYLQQNADVAQVGYIGGYIEGGKGSRFGYGSQVDYIPGWCFCIPRPIYNKFGLFDEENLEFAYCEDADFSLRLQEAGLRIHALHLDLVYHHENKTISEVAKVRDCRTTFEKNHRYLDARWGDFLSRKSKPDNRLDQDKQPAIEFYKRR